MKPRSSERIYTGRILNLRIDEVDRLRGEGTRSVEIVEHAGGVCIVACPSPHEIVLVKQHRYGAAADLWEVPAGMIEHGEPPAETARRELLEETGYRAGSLRFLFSMYSSPGFCEERIHFFVAENLSAGVAEPQDDELFELRVWPVEDAWALVERDEMRDAKTQIALGWVRSHATTRA